VDGSDYTERTGTASNGKSRPQVAGVRQIGLRIVDAMLWTESPRSSPGCRSFCSSHFMPC